MGVPSTVVENSMKHSCYFFLVFAIVGCFKPPGSLCTEDKDCPENQQCIALETRSVCLNSSAGDAGQNLILDASTSPIDSGNLTDTGEPSVDGGSSIHDVGGGFNDAGIEPGPTGIVAALGGNHSCAAHANRLRSLTRKQKSN